MILSDAGGEVTGRFGDAGVLGLLSNCIATAISSNILRSVVSLSFAVLRSTIWSRSDSRRFRREYSPWNSSLFFFIDFARWFRHNCFKWNQRISKLILGKTQRRAQRSMKSVSVIATAGVNAWPAIWESESLHCVRRLVKISQLYPAAVCWFPDGAENRRNVSGTPCLSSSIAIIINGWILRLQTPNVLSSIICDWWPQKLY